MHVKPLTVWTLAATALLGATAGRLATAERATAVAVAEDATLDGGAVSARDLVGRFVEALRNQDTAALRALRIDEREYRDIIVPGSVAPGEPPKKLVADWVDFLWGSYEQKNIYRERDLLAAYGGKHLAVREMSFAGGEREYAGYRALSKLVLTLTDDEGRDVVLEMGSVAQVGGRYKFIAYGRN